MTPARIALVCCAETARGAPDDGPLAAALEASGVEVSHVRWDDEAADWASFDAAAIRSTWDYHLRAEAFLAWVARAAPAARWVCLDRWPRR